MTLELGKPVGIGGVWMDTEVGTHLFRSLLDDWYDKKSLMLKSSKSTTITVEEIYQVRGIGVDLRPWCKDAEVVDYIFPSAFQAYGLGLLPKMIQSLRHN